MNWKKVRQDLYLATGNHVFQKLIGYVVMMMLARHLDKVTMGEFFFAATLAVFFSIFTELGTNRYLIRRIAESPAESLQYLSEVISLRLPLMGLAFVVLNASVLIINPAVAKTVLLTSLYVLLQDFYYSLGAFLLGLRHVGYRVGTEMAGQLLLACLVVIAIALDCGLPVILICYVLAYAAMVGLTVLVVRRRIGRFGLVWNLESARDIVSQSLPLCVLTVLGVIHFKAGTLMLGVIHSFSVVATYEAAYKLLEVSQFIVRPAAMIFFPICSHLAAQQDWHEFRAVLRKLLLAAGALGLGVTVIVAIAADFVITAVFGSQYGESAAVLRVLFLTVPTLYIGFISTFLANSLHLERRAIKITLICVIVNVALNSIAIPLWGPLGAAWTTVTSHMMLTGWLLWLLVHKLREFESRDAASPAPVSADLIQDG